MRKMMILTTAAFIAAIPAIWGATAILAKPQRAANATQAATSIDVMQMMRNAKDLPEQQFGAY